MYALLCRKLCEEAPNFDPPPSNTDSLTSNTFRRLLLAKCQDEFENRRKASEALVQQQQQAVQEVAGAGGGKHKMLGNIKFIGELGKQGLLQEAVLHQCVRQLLLGGRYSQSGDLECLCQILRTVGGRLDTERARPLVDQYFERVGLLAACPDLPARIRFMLQDVLELRRNRWVPRRSISEHAPKTIAQVRDDAARDLGGFVPRSSAHAPPMPSLMGGGKLRSGMDDVFSSMPIGVGSLGTGPGVISTDTFPNYSSNMGRPRITSGGGGGGIFNRPKQFQRGEHHDLFPAYPQRNNTSPRELPPRFQLKKSSLTEEISLRPAQNSMVKNKQAFAKPQLLLQREQQPPLPPPVVVTTAKEPPPVVVKVAAEKGRRGGGGGGPPPTREEVLKRAGELLQEYLASQDAEAAVRAFKDIRAPRKHVSEVLLAWMKTAIEKGSEGDRELLSQLMAELKKEGQLTPTQLMEALRGVFGQLGALETEVPRARSHAAGLCGRAVGAGLVSLAGLAEPLANGAHYPLFLLCLQQLHKAQGRTWLQDAFAQSKVNLLHMLPEMDRTKERLADILEDRGLSFLLPLLRIQADLWKQLQTDPSPTALYRWIKEQVDPQQHTLPGFVQALVACLLKYITGESTLQQGGEGVPEKHLLDREREMLDKFKPVFQAFLHEHPDLQLVALYALQVHCYNCAFPKGMLLRWFMMLYDQEIVEEEAFLKWKEDVNDEYPGKGKALFQVNQWLTWLEEAEEEGSDDGEN